MDRLALLSQRSGGNAYSRADGRPGRFVATGWGAAALILGSLLLRLIYLRWFCPYELLGDEAYYWVQSRHLDLCYNEKGPALPWLIALSCRVFGDTEFAVRLPVALASAAAAWVAGQMAYDISRSPAARTYAVVCFLLLPAFQANAQISTQDGFLILFWLVLAGLGLRLFDRWMRDKSTWFEWLGIWGIVGIATLFKQSAPLLLPGLLLFAVLQRRRLPWRPVLAAQQLAGVALMLLIISPMIVWNNRHGWPMLSHTMGHLAGAGDQSGERHSGNPALWLLNVTAALLGAFGPAAMALMAWTTHGAWRAYRVDSESGWKELWVAAAAWPGILFFVGLSLWKPVVPSWPLPSAAPLIVLIGIRAAVELPRRRDQVRRWLAAADRRRTRRPNTPFHQLWTVMVVYGVAGWLVLAFPTAITCLPLVGGRLTQCVMKRFSGHRAEAQALETCLERQPGDRPVVVGRYYMHAALSSFYLPDHPPVSSADWFLGKRETNFDHWDDTRLDNPALRGRKLLFIGQSDIAWERLFELDRVDSVDGGRYYLGVNYQGARRDNPRLALHPGVQK